MAIIDLKARSIEMLADDYAKSRQQRTRPISIVAAIRAIRTYAPNELSDRELTDIIAESAMRHGHVIDFDGSAAEG